MSGLTRRGLFGGLIGLAAPAIIRTPGLLMPVRRIVVAPYLPTSGAEQALLLKQLAESIQESGIGAAFMRAMMVEAARMGMTP